MYEDPPVISEEERELLAWAAASPDCRSWSVVTRSCLARIAAKQGVDFATALLYERLRQSDRHGPFIRRVDALLEHPASSRGKINALLAVAPGAFYRELPKTGGDGRLLRQHVAAYGCRTEIIPTHSQGSVADNGRVIRDWLADHAHEKILLASLSKGSADVKAALAAPEAVSVFRPVVAWLNLSGLTDGSPVVSRMRQSKIRSIFGRLLCWCKGIDFAVLEQLEWGPGTVLDFPLVLPAHIQLISVVGFPLRSHFTSGALRRFHRRMAALGPNDGMILLSDACALPGLVYPVWGADHRLRPAWDIRRLVAALACYLAETLDLWATPAEDVPCPTKC